MKTMHAGVLHGIRDISYEEIDYPKTNDNEALIRVKCSGMCNSDIERFNGKMIYHYPLVPGHEISGEVWELGKNTGTIKKGDKVAIYPLVPCKACDFCKIGRYHLCNNYGYIGSRTNGGFAEFVKCPVENIVKIGDDISFEEAALIEPLAVALHAIKRAEVRKGSDVVIYGMGPIGFFAMQWAKVFGARNIICVDRNDYKLIIAKKHGATKIVNSSREDVIKTVLEDTNNRGADYIMECSGATTFQEQSISTVKKMGKIVFVGNSKQDLIIHEKEMSKILRKEIAIIGSWNSLIEEDWVACVKALEEKSINCTDIITHRAKLKDIKTVFSDIINKKEKYLKVVFIE